jgi:superfamily II helicase
VALMLECCDESETDREDYSARRGTKVADEIHSLEQAERGTRGAYVISCA